MAKQFNRAVRKKIKQCFYLLGLDISRKPQIDSLKKMLDYQKINLVLDIGANKGQYAIRLREMGYKKKIISFEPLSQVYPKLLHNSRKDKNWIVAERCLVGEKEGEETINISENFVSSSILQNSSTKALTENSPRARFVGSEKVKMHRLDTLLPKYMKKENNILLKLDVQGYEDNVLKGAKKILPKIRGIQLECSLVRLYKGEILLEQMIKKIKKMGFKLWDLIPEFRNYKSGRLMQTDCIFFRED